MFPFFYYTEHWTFLKVQMLFFIIIIIIIITKVLMWSTNCRKKLSMKFFKIMKINIQLVLLSTNTINTPTPPTVCTSAHCWWAVGLRSIRLGIYGFSYHNYQWEVFEGSICFNLENHASCKLSRSIVKKSWSSHHCLCTLYSIGKAVNTSC